MFEDREDKKANKKDNKREAKYTALYRSWRPQLFGDVVGQDHVTRTLQNALASGRIAHAYLFCGLRGTGKTTMAKLLAKALNCLEGVNPEPCNECRSCREVTGGRSVDVLEIDAASNRGIDEIRELREKARYAAAQSRYKVYIIDEVHMLTNEAFNALLKTLEEPPSGVVFILATTEAHRLPQTVISRCQRFDFHLLETGQIVGRLREVASEIGFSVGEETLYLLGHQAEGSVRDALGFMEQCRAYGGEAISYEEALEILGLAPPQVVFNLLQAVVDEDVAGGFHTCGELVNRGRDLHRFLRETILYLRKLVLLQAGEDEEKALADVPALRPYLLQHRDDFDHRVLLEMLEILQQLTLQLRGTSQPQFLMELAFLRLGRAYRFRHCFSPENLLYRLEELEEKLQAAGAGTLQQEADICPALESSSGPAAGRFAHRGEGGRGDTGDISAPAAPTAPPASAASAGPGTETGTGQGTGTGPATGSGTGAGEYAESGSGTYAGSGFTEKKGPDGMDGEAMDGEEGLDVPNDLKGLKGLDGPDVPDESRNLAGPDVPVGSEDQDGPVGSNVPVGSGDLDGPDVPDELGSLAGPDAPLGSDGPGQMDRPDIAQELESFWKEQFLPDIKKQRKHDIHALLQDSRPVNLKDGLMTIAYPPTHSIHKKRIEAAANRAFIESTLGRLLNRKMELRVIFDHSAASAPGGAAGKEKEETAMTAGEESREQKGDDFFVRQMLELFNARLIETDGKKFHSRDFWELGPASPAPYQEPGDDVPF